MHPGSSGDQEQTADLCLSATLDPLGRAPFRASEFGELRVGEVEVHPLHTHVVADRRVGAEGPLRMIVGRHACSAALMIILCPQQVCCIL